MIRLKALPVSIKIHFFAINLHYIFHYVRVKYVFKRRCIKVHHFVLLIFKNYLKFLICSRLHQYLNFRKIMNKVFPDIYRQFLLFQCSCWQFVQLLLAFQLIKFGYFKTLTHFSKTLLK